MEEGARSLLRFLSGLTFLTGGIVAYAASLSFDTTFLLPFARELHLYRRRDLVPEIKHEESLGLGALHFISFLTGLALLLCVRLVLGH
jgi:zinc and cadmium transporter